jgi:hypothetical protein
MKRVLLICGLSALLLGCSTGRGYRALVTESDTEPPRLPNFSRAVEEDAPSRTSLKVEGFTQFTSEMRR